MGKQQMGKIAVSNFLRKTIQLAGLFLLFRFFAFDTADCFVNRNWYINWKRDCCVPIFILHVYYPISAIETTAIF